LKSTILNLILEERRLAVIGSYLARSCQPFSAGPAVKSGVISAKRTKGADCNPD
jgi:hypothetical protein